jgi:hypothetical protein
MYIDQSSVSNTLVGTQANYQFWGHTLPENQMLD